MPYIKKEQPFEKMTRLLKGYDFNGPKMAKVLGVSAVTGKRRLDHPGELTLEDLDRISRYGHVPIEKLREALAR